MRIVRKVRSAGQVETLAAELKAAAEARGVEGRVCGAGCTTLCSSCGSTQCQCQCAPNCPDAPAALSSDATSPLERGIAPLVFELKRTGAFEPCWSCEGHPTENGALWKLPTVWFYCDAQVHLRLLAGGLEKLRFSGALRAPWRVGVTFSDADNRTPRLR